MAAQTKKNGRRRTSTPDLMQAMGTTRRYRINGRPLTASQIADSIEEYAQKLQKIADDLRVKV
jgi:hypothetical protein